MTNVCNNSNLISRSKFVPRRPIPLLVGFMSCLLLSGCGQGKPLYEPGVLRINLGTEPPGLDWHTSTDSTSFDVVSNVMVGLTAYTNDLKCAPSCAESWEVLDGGRRYLFHIRKNILWSDGKPLTAYDFEYAWKRLLTAETAASYAFFLYDIVGAREFNTASVKKPVPTLGIKALDAKTFEVRLNKPAAYFIYLTAFCPTFPMRQDVIEKWGERWTDPEHLITNGPFKLTHWQHEYKMELSANEKFWKGPPAVKKIKMFMVPEQSTAFALYENNELDFIDNRSLATPDVERCRQSPEYKNFPLLRSNYLGFNCQKAPFTDSRVRRAVAMAIDRTIFPKILRRGEVPAGSWIPPALAGYSPANTMPFDPPQARKLLAEAGYPGGKGLPPIEVLYPNRDDVTLTVEAVQDELKRNLSMSIHLENTEWKVYLARVRKDPPQLFRNNWGADYPDAETFMNLFTSYNGNNHTRWSDAIYDKMIEAAEAEQDPAKRALIYEKADHRLCMEQAPIVPSFMATQSIMVKPWVKGISVNPLDLQFFGGVTVGPTHVSNTAPHVSNTAPHVSNTAPHVSNTAPQVSNTAPQVSNTAPHVSNTAPQVSNTAPHVSNTAPHVSNTVSPGSAAILAASAAANWSRGRLEAGAPRIQAGGVH
jgi:oligopeptide transport system substrate-binding protein